jgi:hypothetical protein
MVALMAAERTCKPLPGFVCLGDVGHTGGCYFVPQDSGEAFMAQLAASAPGHMSNGGSFIVRGAGYEIVIPPTPESTP